MGMTTMMKTFLDRIMGFQPATWFGHMILALLVWMLVDITPLWATAVLLVFAVALFSWREWVDYRRHKDAGHPPHIWIADGILDMVGPLAVFWAAVGNPWVALAIGLSTLSLATVVWVGMGYSHYGDEDA